MPLDWIEAGGVAFRYELTGNGEETLVLLHEMGGSLESWDYLLPLLAPHCRVLRFDQRGHGRSELPPGQATIADYANDMGNLLDALDIATKVIPVGVAVGGAVALHFASAHPDRTRAVIAGSPATSVPPESRAGLAERASFAEQNGFRATIKVSLDRGYAPPLRGDVARFARTRLRRLAANRQGFAVMMRMLSTLDMSAQLRAIAVPALLLAGTHDQDRPPGNVTATAAMIPNVVMETLPTGHFMMIQTPEIMAEAILRFLLRHRGATAARTDPG